MNCIFCDNKTKLPIKVEKVVEHLIITKDDTEHYHIHGPLSNKKEILTMIAVLCIHAEIDLKNYIEPKVKTVPTTKEHFENRMKSPEQKRFDNQYGVSLSYNKRIA